MICGMFGSFVESPRQRNLQYLKRGGGVFLKFHIFALVAGAFYKRSVCLISTFFTYISIEFYQIF